jgi:hypothetical protein
MPASITQPQLAEWQRLSDEATPGPWTNDDTDGEIEGPNGGTVALVPDHGSILTVKRTGEEWSSVNTHFICAARTALPLLLAALAERERELAEAREERDGALAALDGALHVSARPYRDGYLCIDCDEHVTSYMVCDEAWAEAVPEYRSLKEELEAKHDAGRASAVSVCVACLAHRLRRDLLPADFNDSPGNDTIRLGIAMGQASRGEALAEVERLRSEIDGSQLRTEEQRQRRDEDRAHLGALVHLIASTNAAGRFVPAAGVGGGVVRELSSAPRFIAAAAHLGLGPDGEAKEET